MIWFSLIFLAFLKTVDEFCKENKVSCSLISNLLNFVCVDEMSSQKVILYQTLLQEMQHHKKCSRDIFEAEITSILKKLLVGLIVQCIFLWEIILCVYFVC